MRSRNKRSQLKSKRTQITIFVIIALIIVVSIALAVVLFKKPNLQITAIENPAAYIEQCAEESLEKNIKILLDNNGYPNKTNNYIVYYGQKIPYLCKAGTYYTPCINQEPLLIEHFRIELEKNVKEETANCFTELVKSFQKNGYEITLSKTGNYTIRFQGDKIITDIVRKVIIKKADETKVYDKFYAQISSPMYDLVTTTRHIINFESTVCNFDYITWEQFYRNIMIKRFISSDQSKIYTLTDIKSNETLSFAVKTCDLPAGI